MIEFPDDSPPVDFKKVITAALLWIDFWLLVIVWLQRLLN